MHCAFIMKYFAILQNIIMLKKKKKTLVKYSLLFQLKETFMYRIQYFITLTSELIFYNNINSSHNTQTAICQMK